MLDGAWRDGRSTRLGVSSVSGSMLSQGLELAKSLNLPRSQGPSRVEWVYKNTCLFVFLDPIPAFHTIPSNAQTPSGCPRIQLATNPTGQGLSRTRLEVPVASPVSVTCASDCLLQMGGSGDHLLRFH